MQTVLTAAAPALAPVTSLPGLSVVLPCLNEEANLAAMVHEARAAARRVADVHELVVVDDGSTDATAELAMFLARRMPELRLVRHGQNRGYGAALRSGIAAARMPWVFLTDADRQFDLAQLELTLPLAPEADLVVGRRARRADPFGRRAAAAAWNTLVRASFAVPVRDVDCAFKLVRRDLLEHFELRSDGAMISTELVVRCMRAGARIAEIDVDHRRRPAGEQSGASPRVVLRAFRELATMRRELALPRG